MKLVQSDEAFVVSVAKGGGGANSSYSTLSCRTSYQDGEEMVKVVQPECLFLKIS